MRNSHVSCFLHKSHKKISQDMKFSHETGDRRFSHKGGCTKKMSCLMRKSHVSRENLMSQENISYLIIFGPPSWENLLSPVSRENLVSQEKISCLFSFGPPQWENLLSPVSWENLMSQEKISCVKRISHILSFLVPPQRENLLYPVSWEILMYTQENLMSYHFGVPPPTRKSPVSCLMRNSHVHTRKSLV